MPAQVLLPLRPETRQAQTASRRDITGGLPRVTELFEARRPKNPAALCQTNGLVTSITLEKQIAKNRVDISKLHCVVIRNGDTGVDMKYYVPTPKTLAVSAGDLVTKGQPLSKDPVDPNEIIEAGGIQELQEYLICEVQKIYCPLVAINCKHIEIIIGQMLTKVRITESGDTKFLRGQEVDRSDFLEQNEWVKGKGGQTAEATPILYGITQAALRTNSFLSAASFQNTTRILAEAAVLSKRDQLQGIKECVMAGKLIPAGTGFKLDPPTPQPDRQVA